MKAVIDIDRRFLSMIDIGVIRGMNDVEMKR